MGTLCRCQPHDYRDMSHYTWSHLLSVQMLSLIQISAVFLRLSSRNDIHGFSSLQTILGMLGNQNNWVGRRIGKDDLKK